MPNLQPRNIVALGLAAIALACMGAGAVLKHKVFEQDTGFADFEVATFIQLTDRDLVADATFTGVARIGGKLYSTYDRSQPRGKRACPT